MADLKNIKPYGLPSYYDLMMAFMDLRDGESDHDIPNETGYPIDSKQAQRIIRVKRELFDTWMSCTD